jgi:Spy/CpxP family protein refolding chaperone
MTKNKWLTITLVISLGINLLLVGFMVGSKFRGPPSSMMMNPMFGLMRYSDTLPVQRRAELLKSMRSFRPAHGQFRQMRELQNNLRNEIRRDPLDPAALKAALTALHNQMQAHQSASHDAFVQLMQSLTPAERVALDEQMQRGGRGHRAHAPGGPHPGPGEPFEEPPPE